MLLRKLFRFLPRSVLGRALGAAHRGDFVSAAALYEEILKTNPHPAADVLLCACETYLDLAREREAAGDVPGALQALERAVALRPRWADVQLHLGQLYERLDQPQRARDTFLRALEANPRYFEARLNLARLLMVLEDRDGALQQLQEAARIGSADAARELNGMIASLPAAGSGPDARARSEALFDKLLAGPPSVVAAGLELARAGLRAGDNALAIAELKRLLQIHPDFPDLHNLLGVAYDNEEMTDDAIEEFETALGLNAAYLDARLNLGLALFERGRDAEAERHLETVASHASGNELARSVLAQIAARTGSH